MATVHSVKSDSASHSLALRVSADKMSVTLTVTPEFAAHPSAIELIRAELESLNIVTSTDFDALEDNIQTVLRNGAPLADLVVARGFAPTPPVDAQVEWARDFFVEGYYVDPDTHYVDYHRKAATPSVSKDELIATISLSQPGADGKDVFGRVIPAARPKPCYIVAGPRVVFNAETRQFRASSDGRVRLDGRVLSVVEVLHVLGDVGIETGNVSHNGSVVIDGSVQSQFKISATGDVEVRGVIAAADVDCGGNLTSQKGISSAFGKHIKVQGQVRSKYVERANISSARDVIVESEILDSSIRSGGKVICTGPVLGGDITAALGIEVNEAGAHTESLTLLAAGIDFMVIQSQKEANEKAKQLKEEMIKLERSVRKLSSLGSHLVPKQEIELAELQTKLMEGRTQYDQLTEARKKLAVAMLSHRDATISIKKQVNAGTMLRIADSHLEIRDTLLGPLVASLNPLTRKIVLTCPS